MRFAISLAVCLAAALPSFAAGAGFPQAPPLWLGALRTLNAKHGPLVLAVNAKGELLVPGEAPRAEIKSIEEHLKERIAERGVGAASPNVLIRVEEDAEFEKVYEIVKSCRRAGAAKVQLRTIPKSKG